MRPLVRGHESKEPPGPASAVQLTEYRKLRDRNLSKGRIPAELAATQGRTPPHPAARDPREPLPWRSIRARPGQICSAACQRGLLDCLFTAAGSVVSTAVFAAIPASAMTVLGPLCGLCALGAGAYTCRNAYYAMRGPQEGDAQRRSLGCRAAIACATGCACGGAAAGAAVIGASPAWIHGAQAAANAMQLGIRNARSGIRDACNAISFGGSDAPRAVDSKGVNRPLTDPNMARMEAMRLLCSTLCYCGLQAGTILLAQPALADAMHADSLSTVLDQDGDFLDRWLATAPGAILGSTVEGLDGFFGTLFAATSALVAGNHVIVDKGRGSDAVGDNLKKPWATFVRTFQNAAMRIGMGNPVTDSQVLATLWADETVVDAFIALVTEDQAILPATATELRGKLLALGLAAQAQAPKQEQMGESEEQTVYVPELGVYLTRRIDTAPAHVEAPEGGDSKASGRARQPDEVRAIAQELHQGVTFQFDGVECMVPRVVPGKPGPESDDVTIASARALGDPWPSVDPEKTGPFPYHYTKKRADMAAALFDKGNGLRAHEIDKFDPYHVFFKAASQASAVRDDKGQAIQIRREPGGDWAAGHLRGKPADVIAGLFKLGCRARHLELPAGAREIIVAKRSVASDLLARDMVSLLWTPGSRMELTRKVPPSTSPIGCLVTPSGIECDAEIPVKPPHGVVYTQEGGKHRYVGSRDSMAAWLQTGFDAIELVRRPVGSVPAHANHETPESRRKLIKKLEVLLQKPRTRTLNLEAAGGRIKTYTVVRLTDADGSDKIAVRRDGKADRVDHPSVMAMRLLRQFDDANPGQAPEIDWADAEKSQLVIRPRAHRADEASNSLRFEWPENATQPAATEEVPPAVALGVPPPVIGVAEIAYARTSIQQLQMDFGTRPARGADNKRARADGVSREIREHNESVLNAYMRVLDGKSFLEGQVLPAGGIRALLDLSSFSGSLRASAEAHLDRLDRALSRGAGHASMTLGDPSAPHEDTKAQAKASVLSDMADAATLLVAGAPVGSGAWDAARRFAVFAQTGGADDSGLSQALDALRRMGTTDDLLRKQALALLESRVDGPGLAAQRPPPA